MSMSPKPRLFLVEAEFTQTRVANYYVFSHSERYAEEKLSEVLHERAENGQGPVILSDDINIQLEQGKPHIRDFSFEDIQIAPVSPTERIIEEDSNG
jgi:hypothetical protein